MSTDIKETYQGLVDGAEVVFAYKAFAEPDQPYCISVNLGGDKYLAATLQPTLPDEFITAAEADGLNRAQIVRWVNVLTELYEKAKAWDDFQAGLDEIAECPDHYTVPALLQNSPYQVDALGEDEIDEVWEDNQGDQYRFDHGEWMISEDGSSWRPILSRYASVLTNYGPYTVVSQPRRAVKQLTETERDADWEFVNDAGEHFVYRWQNGTWVCSLDGDEFTSVGEDGPQLEGIGFLMEIV
ncbi:hypothetical protein FDH96_gp056 [Mycobacterium phage Rey]|uniref:Uncharacterized protein n=1 Tax=Mycobacterium phage Rey TaxID=1034115 RepID=G1D5B8_9CAUD|nr:hypothetical protein FDH96_gp056 [Mycobacterium phage Rey]AEK09968.1 hypothetical protein PBI_REY_56 [Mycobacterium phage Rey]